MTRFAELPEEMELEYHSLGRGLSVVLKVEANHSNTVMERDYRLTGTKRGQSTNVVAPNGFEVSNPWKVWFKVSVSGRCDETNVCNSWRSGSIRTPESIYQLHEFLFFAHSIPALL